jgi:hypothetical protein
MPAAPNAIYHQRCYRPVRGDVIVEVWKLTTDYPCAGCGVKVRKPPQMAVSQKPVQLRLWQ